MYTEVDRTMKVTSLALCPPPAAESGPKVTPELLASCLARYSRSNKGIDTILAGIDWSNPDKSVDAIFKFVDYGHASIAGLTGGIAITIDQCSMLLAYKLFEYAQMADGQESSTRYIEMKPESLCAPDAIGIPAMLRAEWSSLMADAFRVYREVYEQLDKLATDRPEVVRYPSDANEKVRDRIRKNYALDRARYLIPIATKTNVGLVMSARAWAQLIRLIDALGWPEATACASALRAELQKFAPRLTRHSVADAASQSQARQEHEACAQFIRTHGVGIENVPDQVEVRTEDTRPPFLSSFQGPAAAFEGKANRYSVVGERVRRMFVRFAWNNISIAELRDLNRHRTGSRFTPLYPVGFYLPSEVQHPEVALLLERMRALIGNLVRTAETPGVHLYGYLFGVQVPFEHATQADKFIYEVELRTGMGAHYRYAEHLERVCREFLRLHPELAPFIQIGTAEPE